MTHAVICSRCRKCMSIRVPPTGVKARTVLSWLDRAFELHQREDRCPGTPRYTTEA